MTILMPVHIINRELLELTKNALFSIDAGMDNDEKVIIIDNGSEMGGGYMRAIADTYVCNRHNLGFAKAVNQGLMLTDDEYVFIVNNDVRVSPNWKEVAMEVLSEDKTYSCHFKMVDYDQPLNLGLETHYRGMERWCQGSCFVLRRHEPIFYDENYLNSYDDWDFFHNIRNKGYKTAYTNKAGFQHHHSFTQKLIPDRAKNNDRNREYFKSKWKETPEELFWRLYPSQMIKDWKSGFI